MTTTHFPSGGKAHNRPLQETGMSGLVSAMRGAKAAAPTTLTLFALNDGSASDEAFVRFLTELLPNVSLSMQSEAARGEVLGEPALVLIRDPVLVLARRIDEGTAPDHALAAWRDEALALLAMHRSNRQRVLLVNPDILDPTMTTALSALIARLRKIWPNAGTTIPAIPETQKEAAPDAEAIVVAIALLGDASVAEISQELKSATFGSAQDCETQSVALAAWKSATRTRTRAALLHDQLELQGTQSNLTSPQLQEITELYEAEKARAKIERERLLAANRSLEKRRAHAQGRIDALLASSSWRITKPLRAVKGLSPFKRNNP